MGGNLVSLSSLPRTEKVDEQDGAGDEERGAQWNISHCLLSLTPPEQHPPTTD